MNIKILYVGSLIKSPDRDTKWINAFKKLDQFDIESFSTNIFGKKLSKLFNKVYPVLYTKLLEFKLDIIIKKFNPDWIHFRLPIEFSSNYIFSLSKKNIFLTEYFNDDPFSQKKNRGLYDNFFRNLKHFHMHLCYRKKNTREFLKMGAKKAIYIGPLFDNDFYHNNKFKNLKLIFDASFFGHWENDERSFYVESLINAGFNIKIHGSFWNNENNKLLTKTNGKIKPLFGDDYIKISKQSYASLCFFSKLNNDEITERVFEVISIGSLLVAERTNTMMEIFEDRKEVMLFSNVEELNSIILFIKKNTQIRNKMILRAQKKILTLKNTVNDILPLITKEFLNKVN